MVLLCGSAMAFNICFFSSRVQAVLKEHARDDPKLSYTGQPIVRWPKRVNAEHSFDIWNTLVNKSYLIT